MATLICKASGNLDGATTFAAVEPSSLNLIRTNAVGIAPTSTVTSAAFTVSNGAIIDGVILFVRKDAGVFTNTFKVDLLKGGVVQATVTVNKDDLPGYGTNVVNQSYSPTFFKFTSTATGDGGSNWTIAMTNTGGTGQVNYYGTGTSTSFTRALRTTTAATVAAGDNLFITGELTGAGTHNSFTVTMNSTAATVYGSGVVNSTSVYGGGFYVSCWGTLSYGTSAATNYILRLAGDLYLFWMGTLNIGSTGAEIPRNSTAILEFQQTSATGDFGLRCLDYSTFNAAGMSRTSGKNIVKCNLTANVAAAGTTWNVDADTGWLSTDVAIVASTTRTRAECEVLTLSGAAGASSFVSSVGATYAHSGTSPYVAEVGLLTRNVKIRSTSASLMTYIWTTAFCTATVSWVEISYIGIGGVLGKRGIEMEGWLTTCYPRSFTYCSVYNSNYGAFWLTALGNYSQNCVISYNIVYNISSVGCFNIENYFVRGDVVFDNNLAMLVNNGFQMAEVGCTVTNNTIVGVANNYAYNFYGSPYNTPMGTFTNNVAHSGAYGFYIQSNYPGTILDCKIWRNNAWGVNVEVHASDVKFVNLISTGNTSGAFLCSVSEAYISGNCIFSGDTTFASQYGVYTAGPRIFGGKFDGIDFSGTTSIYAPNTIADFMFNQGLMSCEAIVNNCKFGTLPIPNYAAKTYWAGNSYLGFQSYNQTVGDNRTEFKYGQIKTDTAMYKTASPSACLTPNSNTYRVESAPPGRGFLVSVASGTAVAASAYVRKSSTYNGYQPRLMVRRNQAIGITADTAVATMSDVNGTAPTTFAISNCPAGSNGSSGVGPVLSNGNLTATHTVTTGNVGVITPASKTTGKWYFEVVVQSTIISSSATAVGICILPLYMDTGAGNFSVNMGTGGIININGGNAGFTGLGAWSVGDIFSVAVDLDNRLCWFRRNGGNWNADVTYNPATGVGGAPIPAIYAYTPYVQWASGSGSAAFSANFGATTFSYAVPSGFTSGWTAATTGTNAWVSLAGTTATASQAGVMEFYLDCSGATGAINFDDMSFVMGGVTTTHDLVSWFDGMPSPNGIGSGGGGGGGGSGPHFSGGFL